MTLSVNSNPLDTSCNSYVSLAEADTYTADIVMQPSRQDTWDNLDDDVKARYVVNATRLLDNLAQWVGDKYSRDQRLKWPRINACIDGFLLDSTIVPEQVKWATIEMALWLMDNDGLTQVKTNYELDKVSVGSIRIDFNEDGGGSKDQYVPDHVVTLLRDFGQIMNPGTPGSNMAKNIRLERA
jgi:hypothetical protein